MFDTQAKVKGVLYGKFFHQRVEHILDGDKGRKQTNIHFVEYEKG